MFHYRIAILHDKEFSISCNSSYTVYILYLLAPNFFKFLFVECPYVSFTTSINKCFVKIYYLQSFTIYSIHKLLKEFCVLFVKSEFVIGQFPPAFTVVFFKYLSLLP